MELRHPELEGVLREERELVLALGGFALEFAGGILVTNNASRSRFNFVQELSLSRERMSAFFEKALDHYFQRALRPEFHLPDPAPPHLASVLERYGFSPRAEPRSILLCPRSVPLPPAPPGFSSHAARSEELDIVVEFLAAPRERDELRGGSR